MCVTAHHISWLQPKQRLLVAIRTYGLLVLSFSFLIGLILLMSFTSDTNRIFYLGKKYCTLKTQGNSNKIASFISLHDNENTSVEVYLSLTDTLNDITLYELQQTGERLLKYGIDKKEYSFDPNRIFSKIGVNNTLVKYNNVYPQELDDKLQAFADTLLSIITPTSTKGYIVAIHNNTDNNFSVLSYNTKDTLEVFTSPMEDPDDFFIVTLKEDFEYFKSLQLNVVLQSENVVDDGSLSIYCQNKKIPYINIEVQHGHKTQQINMIQKTYSLIKNRAQLELEVTD